MARARTALPPAEALRSLVDAEGRLALHVTPGARMQALEIADGRLSAKVRAKPQDGEANDAVRELLAQALGLAPTRIVLVKGATSREKQFRIG
jgi:uncharacterized protein YggU (UPF0235/DUF167 family)